MVPPFLMSRPIHKNIPRHDVLRSNVTSLFVLSCIILPFDLFIFPMTTGDVYRIILSNTCMTRHHHHHNGILARIVQLGATTTQNICPLFQTQINNVWTNECWGLISRMSWGHEGRLLCCWWSGDTLHNGWFQYYHNKEVLGSKKEIWIKVLRIQIGAKWSLDPQQDEEMRQLPRIIIVIYFTEL